MSFTGVRLIFLALAAAAPREEPGVEPWIAQLGSPSWEEREAASEKLLDAGKTALAPLERALQSPDAEVRHRARELLERLRWHVPAGLSPTLIAAMEQFPALPDGQRMALVGRVANELRSDALGSLRPEGVAFLRQVLRTDPSPAVRNMASERLMGAAPEVAETELRALAGQAATAAWAAATLGDLLARQGRDAEAIEAYERARKAGAKEPEVAAALGDLYERRRQFPKARDLYEELAAAEPDNVGYRMRLGRCHYLLKEPAKAEAVWTAILRAKGAEPRSYLWVANAYMGVGDREKGVSVLREGHEKHPNDMGLLRYLGSMLARDRKLDEAIALYEKALRGSDAEHLRRVTSAELAYLLRQSGQLDAYLQRQQAPQPGQDASALTVLRRLAEAYLSAGELPAARRVLLRLQAIAPDTDDGRWATATLRRISGGD